LRSTYLDDDAELIRSLVPKGSAPPEDSHYLFVLYAVLMRVKGSGVTLSDVHDAWSAWMISKGEEHPTLVPFRNLDVRT
jgi:hypothetical protein